MAIYGRRARAQQLKKERENLLAIQPNSYSSLSLLSGSAFFYFFRKGAYTHAQGSATTIGAEKEERQNMKNKCARVTNNQIQMRAHESDENKFYLSDFVCL